MKPVLAFVLLVLYSGCVDRTERSSRRDTRALPASQPETTSRTPVTSLAGGSFEVSLSSQSFLTDAWQGVLRLHVGAGQDFATLHIGGSAKSGETIGLTLSLQAAAGGTQLLGQHLVGERGPLGVENGMLMNLGGVLYRATEGFVEIARHSAGKVSGSFSGGFQSLDGSGGLPLVRGNFAGLLQLVCMVPNGSAGEVGELEPLNWIQAPQADERCLPYLLL